MYRYMAIANYEDRFVIPTSHREYAALPSMPMVNRAVAVSVLAVVVPRVIVRPIYSVVTRSLSVAAVVFRSRFPLKLSL